MRGERILLACALLAGVLSLRTAWAGQGVAAGERLYREGIGVDGRPVAALSQGDVPLAGAQAACMNCHRPSGLGSSEGGYYVPPINGAVLYTPRKLDRLRLYPEFFHQVQPSSFKARLYQPHMRPAYNDATLTRALRRGIDAAGQALAPIMPRYQLSDRDIAALDAYLHLLSSHPDPGVDTHEIRLATVFSDNVPTVEREAMLSTLKAYVDWHNQRLSGDQSRHGFSVYGRSLFVAVQRRWSLAVWTLTGDPSTWRTQIERQYRAAPVFALVGGRVDGPWSGPGAFCEAERLPCLFPDTELPAWPVHAFSETVYFSAGLMLEAQVLARFAAGQARPGERIVQLASKDAWGTMPAGELGRMLHQDNPSLAVQTRYFADDGELTDEAKVVGNGAGILVVWPGSDPASALTALRRARPPARLILLPSRAISAAPQAGQEFIGRLRFADADELNPASHARSFETWAWMRTRHLGQDHPRLRLKAYYVMTLLDAALAEISNDYYREHLIERMEDESQKDLNPGLYPHLALSPGERLAVKSASVVCVDRPSSSLRPASAFVSSTAAERGAPLSTQVGPCPAWP